MTPVYKSPYDPPNSKKPEQFQISQPRKEPPRKELPITHRRSPFVVILGVLPLLIVLFWIFYGKSCEPREPDPMPEPITTEATP